jgi:lipopolysaccharide transport system permease protein
MGARLGAEAEPFSYSIYLCSGLIVWNFFSEVLLRSTTTILHNSAFMKNFKFPPFVLFGATTSFAAINFIIAFSIFLIALAFIKPISLPLLLLYFFVVILTGIFCMGAGIMIGCLNVFMRDIEQLTSITLHLWFWFTPIVYSQTILPGIVKKMLYFNPAYAFIEPLHQIMYYEKVPDIKFWPLIAGWILLSCGSGAWIYSKTISRVRDHI